MYHKNTQKKHSFIKRFLLAHLLRNVPKKRIADCQPGDYVKVTGQVNNVYTYTHVCIMTMIICIE